MSLADRLRRALAGDPPRYPPVKAAELARACGVKQPSVSAWLSGETKSIDGGHLLKAARCLQVRPEWLHEGYGPMRTESDVQLDPMQADGIWKVPVRPSRIRFPPVIGKGTGGRLPERVYTDGDLPVGGSDEYSEQLSTDPNAFVTEVVGKSQIPRYNPGEYALVEPNSDIHIGDDVLVRLRDGQSLLKTLRSRGGGGVHLGSYNSTEILFYKNEEVSWMYYVANPVPARKIRSRL